jgi:hypothetical protein
MTHKGNLLAGFAMFVLATVSFGAVVLGERYGLKSLLLAGAVLLPAAVLLGGIFVVLGIVRTLRKRS